MGWIRYFVFCINSLVDMIINALHKLNRYEMELVSGGDKGGESLT